MYSFGTLGLALEGKKKVWINFGLQNTIAHTERATFLLFPIIFLDNHFGEYIYVYKRW